MSDNLLLGFLRNEEPESKSPKTVRLFRKEYKRLNEYLKKYPNLLEAAHRDLDKLYQADPTRNRTPNHTRERQICLTATVGTVQWEIVFGPSSDSRKEKNHVAEDEQHSSPNPTL